MLVHPVLFSRVKHRLAGGSLSLLDVYNSRSSVLCFFEFTSGNKDLITVGRRKKYPIRLLELPIKIRVIALDRVYGRITTPREAEWRNPA
jgi:hypothetical protein